MSGSNAVVDADGDGVDADNSAEDAPGFGFFPTEEELIGFYLKNKLAKKREDTIASIIPAVDIYRFDPWQLPGEACKNKKGGPWFFFCPRQERQVHGGRAARTTPSGFWKATGSPGPVYSSSNRESCRVIGEKKTMVFYSGRAPRGTKTNWKMNEYRAIDEDAANLSSDHQTNSTATQLREEFSVCRVYRGTLQSFDRRPAVVLAEASSSSNAKPAVPPEASSRDNSEEDGGGGALDWVPMLDMDCGLLDWD